MHTVLCLNRLSFDYNELNHTQIYAYTRNVFVGHGCATAVALYHERVKERQKTKAIQV